MKQCHDCGAKPGEYHKRGCDVERCPMCGGQAISCDCIYEVNGMDVDTMETLHPKIYSEGPTAEMFAKFDQEWGAKRQIWSGEWPGVAECREMGLWCRMTEHGWTPCAPDDPEAREDLNRLHTVTQWDQTQQKWVPKAKSASATELEQDQEKFRRQMHLDIRKWANMGTSVSLRTGADKELNYRGKQALFLTDAQLTELRDALNRILAGSDWSVSLSGPTGPEPLPCGIIIV